MASSSSHGNDTALHATTSLLPLADATDACLWTANLACHTPRTCYDCLNTAPAKGQCMVDPMGRCVRLGPMATDTARGRLPYFPSTATRYCETSDVVCAACRNTTDATGGYYVMNGTNTLKPFCVGAHGCVCIAACEAPTWSVNVLAVCAPSFKATRAQQTALYLVFLVIASVVCAFVYFFSVGWRKTQAPNDIGTPQWSHRRPKGPGLALTAWLSMRQQLIDQEASQPAATPKIISHRQASSAVDAA